MPLNVTAKINNDLFSNLYTTYYGGYQICTRTPTTYKFVKSYLTRKYKKTTFQNENNSRKAFVLVHCKCHDIHEAYKCKSNAYPSERHTLDIRKYTGAISSFASVWVKDI